MAQTLVQLEYRDLPGGSVGMGMITGTLTNDAAEVSYTFNPTDLGTALTDAGRVGRYTSVSFLGDTGTILGGIDLVTRQSIPITFPANETVTFTIIGDVTA